MSIHMAINRKPSFTPTNFEKLQEYVEFKVDFHHVSIRAWKDPEKKWHDLPHLARDDAITAVLNYWPADWHNATYSTTGSSKTVAQQKKEEAKLKMEQLATKRKKEVDDKAKAECTAM